MWHVRGHSIVGFPSASFCIAECLGYHLSMVLVVLALMLVLCLPGCSLVLLCLSCRLYLCGRMDSWGRHHHLGSGPGRLCTPGFSLGCAVASLWLGCCLQRCGNMHRLGCLNHLGLDLSRLGPFGFSRFWFAATGSCGCLCWVVFGIDKMFRGQLCCLCGGGLAVGAWPIPQGGLGPRLPSLCLGASEWGGVA